MKLKRWLAMMKYCARLFWVMDPNVRMIQIILHNGDPVNRDSKSRIGWFRFRNDGAPLWGKDDEEVCIWANVAGHAIQQMHRIDSEAARFYLAKITSFDLEQTKWNRQNIAGWPDASDRWPEKGKA